MTDLDDHPALRALLKAAVDLQLDDTPETRHALVVASMAVGRLEAYDRDFMIFSLAQEVAKLTARSVDHG